MADNQIQFKKRPLLLRQDKDLSIKNIEKVFSYYDENFVKLREQLSPQPKIEDADGTLEDVTSKVNTLISQLQVLGLLKSS